MLFTAAFVKREWSIHGESSSIQHLHESILGQWKCGLYTSCEGPIYQLLKTWQRKIR